MQHCGMVVLFLTLLDFHQACRIKTAFECYFYAVISKKHYFFNAIV